MESKGKDTSELRNKKFLCEVAFLCDITSHLNALNLQLQGRGRVITDMYATVRAFKTKLRLWETQILQENLSHFPHCQTMKEQVAAAVFPTRQFTEKLCILGADFTRRFADFEAQKSRMVGITKGSNKALCFVIDTTGSMSDEISAMKAVTASLVDSKVGTPDEPSLYIFVPFNDPGFRSNPWPYQGFRSDPWPYQGFRSDPWPYQGFRSDPWPYQGFRSNPWPYQGFRSDPWPYQGFRSDPWPYQGFRSDPWPYQGFRSDPWPYQGFRSDPWPYQGFRSDPWPYQGFRSDPWPY
ncbi:hypothetical protein NHX12_008842 [Muraenolepis orangiensis]|uniref:Hemicentin-1-like von Willebrand factor A domain-containing protein n=1 Tax=Muraenolepis orangiensis TaxID=630683 RepID=A0A9Q0DM31_9TELE|nr:hypothetical protein NHX12_008842 [Muraenolepis orangiensis]